MLDDGAEERSDDGVLDGAEEDSDDVVIITRRVYIAY